MVISTLIATLDRMTAESVAHYINARKIWLDLEEWFGLSSFAQLYSLQEELANITQQLGQNVVTNMKIVWDEFDHLGSLPMCKCNDCILIKYEIPRVTKRSTHGEFPYEA